MLREFVCTYAEPKGSEKRISIMAETKEDALQKLKEKGFLVTQVEEKRSERSFLFRRKRVTLSDLYQLANQMSILMRSGMKIDKALEFFISSTTNESLKETLTLVNRDIKGGKSLSDALEARKLFPQVFVTMIHVGESGGDLQTAFENVAEYLRFQIELRREIINSLTYPFFLLLASLATLVFMFNFIIPRFFAIFETAGEMPLPAKLVLYLGSIFNFKALGVVTVFVACALIFRRTGLIRVGPEALFSLLSRLPLVKTMFFYLQLSRFSYSMHSMLKSGIDLVRALKLSADFFGDTRLKDATLSSITEIKKGSHVADVFYQIPVFPEIVPNLVRVGEESGNLKDIFLELHLMFSEKFRTIVRRFLTLLEPFIIVLMGVIVGFIVISLILTVMNISAVKL